MLSSDSPAESVQSGNCDSDDLVSNGEEGKEERSVTPEVVSCMEVTSLNVTEKTLDGDVPGMTMTGCNPSKGKYASHSMQAVNDITAMWPYY